MIIINYSNALLSIELHVSSPRNQAVKMDVDVLIRWIQ